MERAPQSRSIKPGRLLWLVPALLIQTACVGVSTQIQRYPTRSLPTSREPAMRTPLPSSSLPEKHIEAQKPAEIPPLKEERKTTSGSTSIGSPPAVLALIGEAQTALDSGDLDNAAASLERAIRIQPNNPQIWHDLAEIRLKQRQPGRIEDAEHLAKRSNSYAKGNSDLIRANWAIIAEARRMRGDMEGAAEAQQRAGD